MASWMKILLGAVIVGVIVAGLSRLRMETDILATLPPELPEVRGLKLLRDGFDGGDDLVIGLEWRDEEQAAALTEALGRHLETLPSVGRARWAGTFENPQQAGALLAWALQNGAPGKLKAMHLKLEGGSLEAHLQGVMEKLAESPDPAVVQRWSYDPLGLMEGLAMEEMASMEESGFVLASADGRFRVLFVSANEPVTGYKQAAAWLGELQTEVERWLREHEMDGRVEVSFTGEPAFMAETGAGIEKDMRGTIGATELLITLLFWVMFRRLLPLLWIQLLLVVIMLLTLSLASLVLGRVSVMSLGFAAIVLGIVVDYAVLMLQKSQDHPGLSAAGLRKLAGPGIVAGAGTTSVVFLSLLFSGLPGLGDLGIMVALGVVCGVVVMLGVMPELLSARRVGEIKASESKVHKARHRAAGMASLGLAAGVLAVFGWKGLPAYEGGAEALRPSRSAAMEGWEMMQRRLGREDQASVPLLVRGDERSMRSRLTEVAAMLAQMKKEGVIVADGLPMALAPDANAQAANFEVIEGLLSEQARLRKAVLEAGFTEESLVLSDHVLAAWKQHLTGNRPLQATDSAAAEVVGKVVARDADGGLVVLGSVTLAGEPGKPDRAKLALLREKMEGLGFVHLTGWESLGTALSGLVRRDFFRMTVPLVLVLGIMLWVTFRRARDMVLSALVLGLGIAGLMATMTLMGLSWNLASLAALPLLMGTGIDYGIHIMLAMEREGDDIVRVQATTGRAVFFSGMTTVIGFGTLVFAGNRGIASLGVACCVGTLWILALVLGLLPYWRSWLGKVMR